MNRGRMKGTREAIRAPKLSISLCDTRKAISRMQIGQGWRCIWHNR